MLNFVPKGIKMGAPRDQGSADPPPTQTLIGLDDFIVNESLMHSLCPYDWFICKQTAK